MSPKPRGLISRQKRQNAWLKHLYADSPVMLHSIDAHGNFCDVNNEWLRQTGYSREEVIGKPATFMMSAASASQYGEEVLSPLEREGAAHNVSCEFIRRDGSPMPVTLDCVLTSDEHDQPICLAVVRDMSEINRLHQQSLEYAKLQSVLELAGTICHELNQPLQVLVGRLDLIRLQDGGNEKLRNHLDSITQSVKKISNITLKLRQLTNYRTKPYIDDFRIIDLNEGGEGAKAPTPPGQAKP